MPSRTAQGPGVRRAVRGGGSGRGIRCVQRPPGALCGAALLCPIVCGGGKEFLPLPLVPCRISECLAKCVGCKAGKHLVPNVLYYM